MKKSLEAFAAKEFNAAASGCDGFPTFRELTPSPSSGCAGGLVAPRLASLQFYLQDVLLVW
jgi:hypothetical protein